MTRFSGGQPSAEHLQRITTLARDLLAADDPYDVGWQLWGDAMNHAGDQFAGNIQALWGSLTDWVELKPA
ncbi:hypothetical protein [Krasilnikovia sp. MM14-A1004]|uniref:hypothetical protein n=1 Tax=Krasilnikovia sp. MM14-A1004 TaxID=3373541 RepID=UPI00399C74F0